MEESTNVVIDDKKEQNNVEDNSHIQSEPIKERISTSNILCESENEVVEIQDGGQRSRENRLTQGHSTKDIIGDPNVEVKTRRQVQNSISHVSFTSKVEPRKTTEVLEDPNWINVMQDELNQFTRNDVWFLTKQPKDKNVIGTK